MEQIDNSYNDPFDNQILWKFSPSKSRIFFYQLKYTSIGPLVCLSAGLIMALTGVIVWMGMLLFGGAAVITFVIICFCLSRQVRPVYTITETKISIYPLMHCVGFTDIEKIRKSRSLFNKNVGTIKFKVKNGMSLNIRFVKIDDVDSVYDLLISLWKKHKHI